MIKLPGFLTEYAQYKKENIYNYPLMKESYKILEVERIERIVRNTEKGVITIDEAMYMISNPFKKQ